jgi:ubiquinone/menaquinone biosynthesis C-methylase UbiE
MLSKAQQAAAKIRIAATVKLAIDDAQNLQFPDDSFDTVIMCLVLCTIPDPLKALQEAYRVLKPNGQLIFLEHVRAPNNNIARLQNWATPAWKHLGCGCHLNRDTEQTLIAAGFKFLQITRYQHPKMMKLGASMIQGVAVKR